MTRVKDEVVWVEDAGFTPPFKPKYQRWKHQREAAVWAEDVSGRCPVYMWVDHTLKLKELRRRAQLLVDLCNAKGVT